MVVGRKKRPTTSQVPTKQKNLESPPKASNKRNSCTNKENSTGNKYKGVRVHPAEPMSNNGGQACPSLLNIGEESCNSDSVSTLSSESRKRGHNSSSTDRSGEKLPGMLLQFVFKTIKQNKTPPKK